MTNQIIRNGDRVKDMVTGFQGIVIATIKWLHGCQRYAVQPEALDKDGKRHEEQWFDEPQLEVLDAGALAEWHPGNGREPGGPRNDPKRY